MLAQVPGLEELGMVGEALSTVYSNANKWLSFQRLVDDYQQQKAIVPKDQQSLYSVFNPESRRTELFLRHVTEKLGYRSLNSLVERALQGDSISQVVFAEGISGNGLNLPITLCRALEELHLPQWKTLEFNPGDARTKSYQRHCRTLFGAYSRYIAALGVLEAVMGSLKVPV